MSPRPFHGSIVALVTPMDEQGSIDFESLDRLIDWHVGEGTDALVIAGTTGESATLDEAEFSELLGFSVERCAGRIPVLAGTGGPSTAKAVKQTRRAAELGADGALVVTPYYNRPTQSGLEAHYRAIAAETDLPLVLYNVPTRTGVDMQPATVERLVEVPGIVAIKEAVGDLERVKELVDRCGDGLTVLSGDDPTCFEAARRGAKGVISVAANVVPAAMARLVRLAGEDAFAGTELNAKLDPLYAALALESNPIPVKWSVYRMGLAGPGIRLPLQPLAEKYRAEVEKCLADLDIDIEQKREEPLTC